MNKLFYPNTRGLSTADLFSLMYEKNEDNKWVFHTHGEDIVLDRLPPFESNQISDVIAQDFVNELYEFDEGDEEERNEAQREVALKYWHAIVKDLNCTVDHPI